jgi:UDP-N-acetylenolpyruvoylglucosamine reductase
MTTAGLLRHDVNTAALSEWGVGGVARAVYTPSNEADLATFLAELRTDEPLLVLGQGAFLVVRNGGFPGMLIRTVQLDAIRDEDAGLYVEAGTRCAQVAHHAAARGLAGFDWLAGVPGSIGGALMTNAGVGDRRLWTQVAAVNLLDRQGHAHRRSRESFGIGPLRAGGNRHPGETIAGVWLNADAQATADAPGQVFGARAIAQLFSPEDVTAVMDAAPVLDGAVRLDRASAQLHLDDSADAGALEAAIEALCAAASRIAGRPVACRLRFVGASYAGVQGS